ncbi:MULTISPECIES: copper resistance CopC family protein [unclassified Micromonospora]|uniref:copper resistance CopC family protein n=1 Tax=unclassified Micromonospora TaxID=2617518 RepID=UPI001C21496B|nr:MULTISPECIES: copper resistance CopC family protein [unclassified Micromonospora]MBU8861370.1 copper resistance protein CopC [Micromonospora sp. WMMB482]MDM4780928.1 copper resistance protein CopC [Micromonospora sp. b486]
MRTRSVTALLAAVFTALLLVPATPAAAHNSLQEATPARDARLTAAPTQVTLRFLQRLNPSYTTITVSDAGQRKVPTSAPAVDGATGTVTIDEPLGNGTYTVAYRVVSRDGHPVQGSYRFTVADPAAPVPSAPDSPSAPAPAAAAASTDADAAGEPDASGPRSGDDGPPVALLAGGAVAGLVVVAGIVLLVARRARARRADH